MARPSATADQNARRDEILDIAQAVLAEKGYKGASMLEIARRSGASKETLYTRFGDKRGLFAALIDRNAEEVRSTLCEALPVGIQNDPAQVLLRFATALLRLLTGEESIAINRAAISEAPEDPTLAQTLIGHGRHTVLPLLNERLDAFKQTGILAIEGDSRVAAEVLIGLVLGDMQIRRLLGAIPPLTEDEITARSRQAVTLFLRLYAQRQSP